MAQTRSSSALHLAFVGSTADVKPPIAVERMDATPLSPAAPDTVTQQLTITTLAGDPKILVEKSPFSTADIGKLITLYRVGPREGRLVTRIAGVSAGAIAVQDAPTQAAEALPVRAFWGSDQSDAIQSTLDAARAANRSCVIRAGAYLVSRGLVDLPAPSDNWYYRQPRLCQFDSGARIIAGAPMTAVWTVGASNWSGYLHNATVRGGELDGNFVADIGFYAPFFIHLTRTGQNTKNTMLAGAQYGDPAAPAASAAAHDVNNFHMRDMDGVAIAAIMAGRPPTVTTNWDHGFATGRVVYLAAAKARSLGWWRIAVTGPRSFTLDDFDGRDWDRVVGGEAFLTFPGMAVVAPVNRLSAAADGQTIVTTGEHGLKTGDQVFLANVATSAASLDDPGQRVDGVYSVKVVDARNFAIPAPFAKLGAFTGGGWWMAWTPKEQVSKGVYNANATDFQSWGDNIYGVRWGITNREPGMGWDAKAQGHVWNYPQNGQLFAGFDFAGDTTLTGAQVDCPALFAFRFFGPRNVSQGSRLNCAGFSVNPDNVAAVFRLEKGASLSVRDGGAKGEKGHRILAEVSGPAAPLGQYGRIHGYERTGFAPAYVSFAQPDSTTSGSFYVDAFSGQATLAARGQSAAVTAACAIAPGSVGANLYAGANGAGVALTDERCKFKSGLMWFPADGSIVLQNLPTSCAGRPSGALWRNGSALQICP